VEITIRVDAEKLIQLLQKNPDAGFVLDLEISEEGEVKPEKSITRKRWERTRKKNIREASTFIQPPDEQNIIDYWNNSELRKKSSADTRKNLFVDREDYPTILPNLKKAIRDIGPDRIKKYMDSYFECCDHDGHIWDGINHGFKNLGGFLWKLLECNRTGKTPWWEYDMTVQDEHPDLTEYVISEYSLKFLKTDGISTSRADKINFVRAKNIILRVVEGNFISEDPFESFVRFLLKCIEKRYSNAGVPVLPVHLTNATIWRYDMPQYLDENLSISSASLKRFQEVVSKALVEYK